VNAPNVNRFWGDKGKMAQTSAVNIRDEIVSVVNGLSIARRAEVLDFALFVKQRQAQQQHDGRPQPVQRLEDLWGDFWPANESVDDFIDAVRRWRSEDIALHKDLQ
jgi:hypothetical protein